MNEEWYNDRLRKMKNPQYVCLWITLLFYWIHADVFAGGELRCLVDKTGASLRTVDRRKGPNLFPISPGYSSCPSRNIDLAA